MPTDLRAAGARTLTSLAVLVASTAVAVLALATARGVTRLTAVDSSTEFISAWWWLAFLLVPVPALTAWWHPRTAAVQTVALVLPQFAAATVCVARYRSSGWASGLEVLAYLHPFLLTVVSGLLVLAPALRRHG